MGTVSVRSVLTVQGVGDPVTREAVTVSVNVFSAVAVPVDVSGEVGDCVCVADGDVRAALTTAAVSVALTRASMVCC